MKKSAYYIRLTIASIVLIGAILAVLGFYPFKFLDIEFGALLQRTIHHFSIPAVVILSSLVILTVVFGRFYCSTLCPLGILQEFFNNAFEWIISLFPRPLRERVRVRGIQPNFKIKYLIAAITFGVIVGGSIILFRHIDPYAMFGSAVSLSIFGLVSVLLVLTLVFFKNRFFCTNICPVGAILGLLSKISPFKIRIDKDKCVSCGMCLKSCQSDCIDYKNKTVDNETCVKCLKCPTVCPKDAIFYGVNREQEQTKFSPKRREIIWAVSTLALFGAAVKTGRVSVEKIESKIKEVILPAGSVSTNRMYHKCLNCNLCINNCPNKILEKANEQFGAVHINYDKGEGYCKYDCNECSQTCPADAIKKISLEEKQKTRIAMATIIKDKCTLCGICSYDCPTGAIVKTENEVFINGSKCIGCGRCRKSCRSNAIEIFAVNEQKMI